MRSPTDSSLTSVMGGAALLWTCLTAGPALADEIVGLVDDRGHKVYINTNHRTPQPLDWATRAYHPERTTIPPNYEDIDRLVQEAASRLQLDPKLVHAVIQVESEYDPQAVSSKGALGLMQLIPATARRFGVENPFDPKQNIEGGVSYLKYLLDLFQGNLALSLAAYNAGENLVLRHGGIPSLTETRAYVRKVSDVYRSGSLGSTPATKPNRKEPEKPPIIRYVDERGIVHYTNVD